MTNLENRHSACVAFKDVEKETIKKAITTFYNRFFTQQFKRNCMPDGVKVGSICFSPIGDGECQVMHQEIYGQNKWRKFNSPTFLMLYPYYLKKYQPLHS